MNEVTLEKEPLKPWDGTPVSLWKTNTKLRKALFDLSEFVPIMLKLETALQDDDVTIWWHVWDFDKQIELSPRDEEHARKIVGKLIFAFGRKPQIKKVSDDALESFWSLDGGTVTVKGYKPKTCRYEEIEVKVPATRRRIEKKIIPAQKARVEKRRVLVCDDVAAKPLVQDDIQTPEQVPF